MLSTSRQLAFSEYVRERRPVLLRMAYALGHDPHDAEDLLQTVLAKTCVSWENLRDPRAADAYVRRALVNQSISWWRLAKRTAEISTDDLPEPHSSVRAGASRSPQAGCPPDERRRLWLLVQSLPPKQRVAVALRFYEDLSEADTARALGCSVGTVKSNTSRGLATLRSRLACADAGSGAATTHLALPDVA
jgi:RNA polymerase sigma-70 factor (sigma-E family)